MPKLLKDLKIEEISLVDDPANPGAKVLFYKNKDGQVKKFYPMSTDDAKTFNEIFIAGVSQEKIDTLCASLSSIARDSDLSDADKSSKILQSISEFSASLGLSNNSQSSEEAMKKATISKSEANSQNDMTIEEKAAAYDALMAEKAKLDQEAKDKEDKKIADEQEQDAVEKSAAFAELKKKNESLLAQITKFEQEAKKASLLQKSKSILGETATVPVEVIADLLGELSETSQDKLATVVKALVSQVKATDLFKSVGNSGAQETDVVQEVQDRVTELKKSNPKLTDQQARASIFAKDASLRTRYNAARN